MDFRRSFVKGLAAALAFVLVAGFFVADVFALRSGRVPGGGPMLGGLAVAGLVVAGLAGLAVVAGPRAALRMATARPGLLAGASGVAGVAMVLAVTVHPVLIPVLLGFTLFAMHVLVARAPKIQRTFG